MAEHIERDSLMEKVKAIHKAVDTSAINNDYNTGFHSATSQIMGMIDSLPAADVVEVVRCKDCIKCVHDKIFGHYWCNRMNSTYKVKPDDFCSYGERMEGDADA